MKEEGGLGLPARIGAAALVVGLLATSLLPLTGAFTGSSSSGDAAKAQLSRVPVFAVTDADGRPFLTEAPDGLSRMGYLFIRPTDADEYVSRAGEGARVRAVGLNEAYTLVQRRVPARGVPERFQLFPDERQVLLAAEATDGEFGRKFGRSAVPLFYVEGLALGAESGRKGETVLPLFFEKGKLDETLAQLNATNAESTLGQKDVRVIDLRQTIAEIRAGANPELGRVVLIPTDEALARLRELNQVTTPADAPAATKAG